MELSLLSVLLSSGGVFVSLPVSLFLSLPPTSLLRIPLVALYRGELAQEARFLVSSAFSLLDFSKPFQDGLFHRYKGTGSVVVRFLW